MRWKQFNTPTLMPLALMLTRTLAIVLALGFAAAPATAAKPSGAEHDKKEHSKSHKKHAKKHGKKKSHKKTKAKQVKHDKHFRKQDDDAIRNYYRGKSHKGKSCPPGLAKKNNGCMPPGQAKKQWTTGEPLPHDAKHHELPRDLLSKLPLPPEGKRYVRIFSDVLLIDANTDVVIDAIVDVLIP
ncbi:MAG: Ni/Co efflux regulator RcnB [Gammaproteobacteria bacterium]|jgi:Ni/Co efflux regulator RcnB